MNADCWFVWTGHSAPSVFRRFDDAFQHCRVVANDHRRKRELEQFEVGAWRYVGPRGRRHGRRLVAWICTLAGAEMIGLSAVGVGVVERKTPLPTIQRNDSWRANVAAAEGPRLT